MESINRVLLYDEISKPVEDISIEKGILFPAARLDVLIDFMRVCMELRYEKYGFKDGVYSTSITSDDYSKNEITILSGTRTDISKFLNSSINNKKFGEAAFNILREKYEMKTIDNIDEIYKAVANGLIKSIKSYMKSYSTIILDRSLDCSSDFDKFCLTYISIDEEDMDSHTYRIKFGITNVSNFISDEAMEPHLQFFDSLFEE